jgi:RHH-type proline utilization regulon transcriptional repressor/proline dehydrogenase/delta 1-pyrroline-5-carboxylate dehydrogenase
MPFSPPPDPANFSSLTDAYLADESALTRHLAQLARCPADQTEAITARATDLTAGLLQDTAKPAMVDAFLQEYSLSSEEGVLLMRLAESLIRTPDHATAAQLLRDKLSAGDWRSHWRSHLRANHPMVKAGTLGLLAAKAWTHHTGGVEADHLFARLGDRVILSAVRAAIGLLGRHFVLGTSISNAVRRARRLSDYGATYSYDMLGEAALTAADADRYFDSYKAALAHLARTKEPGLSLHQSPALSVKLSALHPRYEYAQRETCVPALSERLLELCALAKSANLGLTIDAEEVDRLEVSLLVFEQVLASAEIDGWAGLGLALQAYQKRALPAIDWIAETARRTQRQITMRLVKGAYWDSEIKRAQELGLSAYPVFTRKEHTDISYLACAQRLLGFGDRIYPQFATHNARTAASIAALAGRRRTLEYQRLHGMSDGLHRRLAKQDGFATRTYAPVGRHEDLLPYLVRRLLENGANASFVNQLQEPSSRLTDLVEDPISVSERHGFSPHPKIPEPCQREGQNRRVAAGKDLTQSNHVLDFEALEPPASPEDPETRFVFSPNDRRICVGAYTPSQPCDIIRAIEDCRGSDWAKHPASSRAERLRRAATLLETNGRRLMALCVYEAGKTWPDAEAELREAIDFLTYYADQAERSEIMGRNPLGIVACISPWNFPLAIFLGQIAGALSVGNCVIAKPAPQTPLIAIEAIKILHQAGVPKDALHLMIGEGELGAALTSRPEIDGVCFTGSTQTAQSIAKSLANHGRADRPLIAETGGINAMIVDSTALLEQAVGDVVRSAFQSAGQRCSACRLVCVQDDVADTFAAMLKGAMAELRTAPSHFFSSDLGPLIDEAAHARIETYIAAMKQRYPIIGCAPAPVGTQGPFLAPVAFEIASIKDLEEEVFGPVLHLVRYKAPELDATISAINALGFGLTMGLHSRIDERTARVKDRARVGNLYINRDQIGAIVGEQPFGGEGLSGTGPKAGGPNYLKRLTRPERHTETGDLATEIALPGPTGETNTLSWHPRGKLLCLGGDSPAALEQQVRRVQATGNEPVFADGEDLNAALRRKDLKGVVIDGRRRERVARAIAHRPGEILPILSVDDDPYRFKLERVVTVNTTAAGGNTALLANV